MKAIISLIIIIITISIFSISSITAIASNSFSFRSTEANLISINNFSDFQYAKVKFSVSQVDNRPDLKVQGNGKLEITALTNSGKRVVLNLRLKEINYTRLANGNVIVNSNAYGSYKAPDQNPKRIEIKLTWQYIDDSRTIIVESKDIVKFKVETETLSPILRPVL